MTLPVGQDVKATFIQAGKRLSEHKSIEGKLYLPEGPPPGAYSLELQSAQSPDQKVQINIKVDYTPHGLATVIRPTLPWAKTVAPKADGGNGEMEVFEGQGGELNDSHSQHTKGTSGMKMAHILIIMMMGISLLSVLIIMRKKGKLPPLRLPERLIVKLPDRVVKRLSFLMSAPQSLKPSPGTKTIEITTPIKAGTLKDLEKTLIKSKNFIRIPGETIQQASTWNANLGHIVLTALYSKGGVGAVYRGFGSNDPNRQLAIKLPLSHIVEKQSLKDIESIRSEFENNKRLGLNSRLVRFYELRQFLLEVPGSQSIPVFYSIMEFFSGRSLKDLIRSNTLDFHGKMSVAIELLEALGPVHMQGVTHNDIKPGNVLINYNTASRSVAAAKLIDFGSSNLSNKASLDYASPELLLKQPITAKSDLFSLGLLIYEMFEGGLPFPSGNGQGGSHITSDKEFDLQFTRLKDQGALQEIIRGMLVKNPAGRAFASTSDVLARLRTI